MITAIKKVIFSNNNRPWLIFALGIFFGWLIFFAGNYFQLSKKKIASFGDLSSQPVFFEINQNNHLAGNPEAPLTLVVFNDFVCPYCRQYSQTLEKLLAAYPARLRLIWKHFPLNQQELTPAVASECAAEQGSFWPYAKSLYDHLGDYHTDDYLAWADDLSLDRQQFESCLSSGKYEAKIKADYYEGVIKGVLGAPATFINGQYIAGAIPLEKFNELLKDELPKK